MSLAARLDAAIKAVAPITGVRIRQTDDRSTWEAQFLPEATQEQRDAAQAVIDGFDPTEPDPAGEINGDALRERQRAEKKAHALSLLAQGKTQEAIKEMMELI